MITNEKIFNAIKSQSLNRAIEFVKEFIASFKTQRVIRDSGVLRLDEFYSGRYTLSRLIPQVGSSESGFYVYDEEKWCRGCSYDCNRVNHNLQLANLSDSSARKIAKESLSNEYPLMHALSRNLLLGSDGFRTFIETHRGREWHDPIKESASLEELESHYHTLKIPYNRAIGLIEGFRNISKAD